MADRSPCIIGSRYCQNDAAIGHEPPQSRWSPDGDTESANNGSGPVAAVSSHETQGPRSRYQTKLGEVRPVEGAALESVGLSREPRRRATLRGIRLCVWWVPEIVIVKLSNSGLRTASGTTEASDISLLQVRRGVARAVLMPGGRRGRRCGPRLRWCRRRGPRLRCRRRTRGRVPVPARIRRWMHCLPTSHRAAPP
ncbi:hypothetical protein BMS3Bbin01_02634 [bacterium BMS3Bbin01]|nr:hypothetical protein BMS3Bbin01_02634 [bacterium BMS3Bbin01]